MKTEKLEYKGEDAAEVRRKYHARVAELLGDSERSQKQQLIEKNLDFLVDVIIPFINKVNRDETMHCIPRFLVGAVLREDVLPNFHPTMPHNELDILFQKIQIASVSKPTLRNFRRAYPEYDHLSDEECNEIIWEMDCNHYQAQDAFFVDTLDVNTVGA